MTDTDTDIPAEHVDLSVEDDSTQYWAASTKLHESPAPAAPEEGADVPHIPGPPPAPPRDTERHPLLVKLGYLFSGGPNGN